MISDGPADKESYAARGITVQTWAEFRDEVQAEEDAFLANAERYDLSTIIEQYRSWAVTDYGVECLESAYAIEKSRIHDIDWPLHMAEKQWPDMYDFLQALGHARQLWPEQARRPRKEGPPVIKAEPKSISPRRRFEIFQRDGFRCGLCGRDAAHDQVRLQVDHMQPRSKGGGNEDANLWTLCADCNVGKSDRL